MNFFSFVAQLVILVVCFSTSNAKGNNNNNNGVYPRYPRCDNHCIFHGCQKYGTGKCDRLCLPMGTWRLREFDHTCQHRCGGHCLYCRSHYWCDVCWKEYRLVLVNHGTERICRRKQPKKCHKYCADPENCDINGQCNGPCKSGYTLKNKVCISTAPVCNVQCLSDCLHAGYCDPAGAPGTTECNLGYGPSTPTGTPIDLYVSCAACDSNCGIDETCDVGAGRCDDTCIANYYVDVPSNFCTECDAHCDPTVPGSCTIPGTCDTFCVGAYVLSDGTLQCQECQIGCATCSDPLAGCDTCLPTYVQDAPVCSACDSECTSGCQTAGLCDPLSGPPICNPGYGKTTTGPVKCGACDPNCAVSGTNSGCNTNGSGFCDGLCNNKYVFVSLTKMCAACQTPDINFCSRCVTPGYCTQCAAGYSDTATPGTCQ